MTTSEIWTRLSTLEKTINDPAADEPEVTAAVDALADLEDAYTSLDDSERDSEQLGQIQNVALRGMQRLLGG